MATATSYTAARMKEIEDNTVTGGFVDVNGHLLLSTRKGTQIDAGSVKGADGKNGQEIVISNIVGTTTYVRLAEVNGRNAIQLLLSGMGSWNNAGRQTALIHLGQRGADTYIFEGFYWGSGIQNIRIYTRKVSAYLFELWLRVGPYANGVTVTTLAIGTSSTLTIDNISDVDPGGLVEESLTSGLPAFATQAEVLAGTVTDKIVSPATLQGNIASTSNRGVSQLATSAEVQAGTVTDKTATPSGIQAKAATNAESQAGSLTTRFITPASLQAKAATNAEASAGTATNCFVTPANLGALNFLPSGGMIMWGGATAPTGFLLCNGAAVSRTTYAVLFAAIGTTYGSGNGSSTFNLPDFTGRGPMGFLSGNLYFSPLGKMAGAATHTLSTSEMPKHSHQTGGTYGLGWPDATASNRAALANGSGVSYAQPRDTFETGGGMGHNNLQPYLTVNFIIKT